MSAQFLRSAFCAAKGIMQLRIRSRVAALIADLRRPPRGQIGQLAWEAKAQLLGYLLVDQRRAQLPPGFAVEPLTTGERALIAEAHGIIAQVNRACLEVVSTVAPYAVVACDPYSRFTGLDVPTHTESLPPELLTALQDAMAEAPAVRLFQRFGGTIPEKAASAAGEYVEQRLLSVDADSVPQDLVDLLRPPMEVGAQTSAMLGIAVAAVRSSIRVVDQLLFQAFLRDKLHSFNESNVFAVPSTRRHRVGTGYVIESVPPAERSMLDSGEVVVLESSIGTGKEGDHSFCSVGSMVMDISEDAGISLTVQLRELDEHACEFPNLVASALALGQPCSDCGSDEVRDG